MRREEKRREEKRREEKRREEMGWDGWDGLGFELGIINTGGDGDRVEGNDGWSMKGSCEGSKKLTRRIVTGATVDVF